MSATDVLDRQAEALGTARGLAGEFVDSGIAGFGGLLAAAQHEREDTDLIGPKGLGARHGAIEKRPLIVQRFLAFGRLGRQRDFEKAGAFDRDFDAVLVENSARLTNLFDRLFGVVPAPDIADLGPLEVVLSQESGGGQDVVIDLVGEDAELDPGQRQGLQAAGEESAGACGEEFTAAVAIHASDYRLSSRYQFPISVANIQHFEMEAVGRK